MKKLFLIATATILIQFFQVKNCSAQFWDTFESYSNQTEADASWPTDNTTGIRVNVTNDNIDFDNNASLINESMTYDLGAPADNTQWVMRFKLNITQVTPRGDTNTQWVSVSLSDSHTTHPNYLGLHMITHSGIGQRYSIGKFDSFSPTFSHGLQVETIWVEMIRLNSTTFQAELFSDEFVTSIEAPITYTVPAGIEDLQYVMVKRITTTGPNAGRITGTVDDIKFCDGTTVFNCDPIPLPIELLSFSAKWQDDTYNTAVIEWQTANETNNNYFEIERSTDAINFYPIMQVDGLNNNEPTDYQELDTAPYKAGVSYYRLKQVDNDGTFSYSKVEALNVPEGIEIINLYPNPVQDVLNFSLLSSLSSEIEIRITNALGQKILEQSKSINDGLTDIHIDLSSVGDGNYYLEVALASEKFKAQKKFIVNKKK